MRMRKMLACMLAAVMLLAMTACGDKGPSDKLKSDIKELKDGNIATSFVDESELSGENKESYKTFLSMLSGFDYTIAEEEIAEDGKTATVKLVVESYDFGTAYLDAWDEILESKEAVAEEDDFYRIFFEKMTALEDTDYISEVIVNCKLNDDGEWETDLATNAEFMDAIFGGMIGIVKQLANM
ncbi:MAG: hypothetical protein PUD55_03500 [Firmicutes bacterium]|nr:hypothetical protein [Bacillota bacterium]